MNLTKFHKEAIVAAVIADIPRARKDPHGDAQKIMDADIAQFAPKEIAAMWKDKALACYLDIGNDPISFFAIDRRYGTSLGHLRVQSPRKHTMSDAGKEAMKALYDELIGEADAIAAAETALTNSIAGLRTRKAFVAMFPELEKYAPAEPTMGTNLPAIANVMADLTKLGWPKGAQVAV